VEVSSGDGDTNGDAIGAGGTDRVQVTSKPVVRQHSKITGKRRKRLIGPFYTL
jgi:hypothetical protein